MRRAVVAVVSVLLAAAAVLLDTLVPRTVEERFPPLATTGDRGERVVARPFAVRLTEIAVARDRFVVVRVSGGTTVREDDLRTAGLWVLVRARVTSRREPISLGAVELVTADGVRYAETDRLFPRPGDTDDRLEPTVPENLVLAFEVPESARLAGAVVEVTDDPAARSSLGAVARVRLGLGDAEARRLVDRAPRGLRLEWGTR